MKSIPDGSAATTVGLLRELRYELVKRASGTMPAVRPRVDTQPDEDDDHAGERQSLNGSDDRTARASEEARYWRG